MTDINQLAAQFTDYYYKNFDTNRSQLASLYRSNSMLTFENSQIQGVEKIIQKLMELPFEKVLHKITTIDAQPSMLSGGSIIVMVTGQLLVDEEQNPQQYSQTFHLIPEGNTFYVLNDIFRLNYS
ncbi:hypothetical protein PNEG_03333 [Pneumocystis murina B123]|uniref:Nuclear transport factor 2 n=1 Tax=Pneumocystis murina (strain B123) TaxID=1069680 RepID=M7NHW5_PNEMU|nr:hypothetical protein PNEG_03333 [Pneumocystis murina B123]EMR08158.1 hypothetical protein PNEG_03333 [Pneumocystis murina B123]